MTDEAAHEIECRVAVIRQRFLETSLASCGCEECVDVRALLAALDRAERERDVAYARARRTALDEAISVVERAFETSAVVEDTLAELRALRDREKP